MASRRKTKSGGSAEGSKESILPTFYSINRKDKKTKWQVLAEESLAAMEENESLSDISVDTYDGDDDFVPLSETDDSDDDVEVPDKQIIKTKKVKQGAKNKVIPSSVCVGESHTVRVLSYLGVNTSAGNDNDNVSESVISKGKKRQSGKAENSGEFGNVFVGEDDGEVGDVFAGEDECAGASDGEPNVVGDDNDNASERVVGKKTKRQSDEAENSGEVGRPNVFVGEDDGAGPSTPRQRPTGVSSGGSMGSAEGSGGHKQPRRKKLRLVSEWEKTKAKTSRNLGKEYRSYKSKKIMPARRVGEPCKDGCFATLGDDKIDEIFSNLWALGDLNLINNYIVNCMKVEKYKRKYTKKQVSQKDVHVVFYVVHGNKEYRVCRLGFQSMHGIGKKKMELMVAKKKKSMEFGTGTIEKDMRGRNEPGNKIRGPDLDCVHEYILSLPTVESHYTRAKAKHRLYLPYGGNVASLYRDYQRFMEAEHRDVSIVKESFFRFIFNTCYNITFEPPATDRCNTCERLENEIQVSKSKDDVQATEDLEAAYQSHKELARIAQNLLKEDEALGENSGAGRRVISIDLQQTLPVPKLPVNVAYYKRKMWLYNFCVFDITKDQPYMFLWDETQAIHGPNEISSCLNKWLDLVKKQDDGNFDVLRIYADNCAGQNKNIYIITMLLQWIQQKWFLRIELVFLVSGHTFLPCDRAFGVISQHLDKSEYICSVSRYETLIKEANKDNQYKNKKKKNHNKTKKNIVVRMEAEDIKDIKVLEKLITNRSAGLKQAHVLIIDGARKDGFFMMNDYSLEERPECFVSLIKGKQSSAAKGKGKGKGRGRPKELILKDTELPVAYPAGRAIKTAKADDLKFLIPFMPRLEDQEWCRELIGRQKTLQVLLGDQQDTNKDDPSLQEDPSILDDRMWDDVDAHLDA